MLLFFAMLSAVDALTKKHYKSHHHHMLAYHECDQVPYDTRTNHYLSHRQSANTHLVKHDFATTAFYAIVLAIIVAIGFAIYHFTKIVP